MQFSKKSKPGFDQGFTLVEMLVVAPLIIILIGGFVGLIIILTGNVIKSNAENSLLYSTNTGLKNLESDVARATEFSRISFTPGANQGADFATKALPFDTLAGVQSFPTTERFGTIVILRTPATTKDPSDPASVIAYSNSPTAAACGTADAAKNDPYMVDIVYYTKFDDPTWSIWRRVILSSDQIACAPASVWQRPTCAPGQAMSATCLGKDQLIFDQITDISLYYPKTPDTSTPDNPGTPAYDGFLDCINPCPYITTPTPPETLHFDRSKLFDPNSTTGESAKAFWIEVTRKTLVAGEEITQKGEVYAAKSG